MKHPGPAATLLEQERFRLIYNHGCLACRLRGLGFVPCQVDHLLAGGIGCQRRGHRFTIGLCPWHHQGDPSWFGCGDRAAHVLAGPSRAKDPLAFRSEFGTDDLLLRLQDHAIAWVDVQARAPRAFKQMPKILPRRLP